MSQECSTHAMSESCPACRVVDHYEMQLQLARLQEENKRLREALDNVVHGAVGGILINGCTARKVHPGRPCVELPFIDEEKHAKAVADVIAGRRLLADADLLSRAAEGVRDRETGRAGNEGRDRQVMGAGSISHGQSGDLNIAPGHAAAETQPASPHSPTGWWGS